MTKTKKRKRRILLETSGVIYRLHGESRMQAAVEHATSDGRVEVSNFIRMEYLRGVIVNLIDFYFLIKESDSVDDALFEWSQKFQVRAIKIVMMSARHWLVDQEDCQSREKSLRRLGDGIVRLVYEFDELLNSRMRDHLRCELGRVFFRHQPFSEDMLLDFSERFQRIHKGTPNCNLCGFKDHQLRKLTRRGIDLHSPAQREANKKNKGFVKQAERLEQATGSGDVNPKCSWCKRLGDSIIALHTPDNAVLVTADCSFEALGTILGREVRLLPSLAQLKKQQQEETRGQSANDEAGHR
ncbi:MAG: hypothetical protein ACC628_12965 [Pirellulaceae bacterium]